MNIIDVDRIKGQIQQKIKNGDYITLGQLIKCNKETARTRYRRGKKEAVLAMQMIINNREALITSYTNLDA